jgi:type IV pilus assembly protein PilA
MKQMQKGFTLIELMIVVAIIGILAAVAIPAYSNYTKKAKYTEVVQATQAIKTGIEACQADMGDLTLCYAGTNGVPNPILGGAVTTNPASGSAVSPPSPLTLGTITGTNPATFGKYVEYVVVYPISSVQTEIVAAAFNEQSLNGDTYGLIGDVTANGLEWHADPNSACLADNICKR